MIPKEKAKEIIDKFLPILFGKKPFYKKSDYFKAKQCALICVDEMIKPIEILMNDKNLDIGANATAYVLIKDLLEVKQEIENYDSRSKL